MTETEPETNTPPINPDEVTEVDPEELRNRVIAKEIINRLYRGDTFQKIADEFGLHRNTLYAIVRNRDIQQLLLADLTERESSYLEEIEEMTQSPSPADRRTALQEKGKYIRHLQDKIFPTLTKNLNVKVDISKQIEPYQQALLLHEEAIRRLPRHMRETYHEKEQETRREWGIQ